MNRLLPPFTALREFTLNGTNHRTQREQGSMIRRHVSRRNRHTAPPLRRDRCPGQTQPDKARAWIPRTHTAVTWPLNGDEPTSQLITRRELSSASGAGKDAGQALAAPR